MKPLLPLLLVLNLLVAACAAAGSPGPLSPSQIAHKSVRVAAVQIEGPWQWRVPTTAANDPADPLLPYIERAALDGADMVVFPELYLGMFRVPSPQTDKIAAAARKHHINVLVGCFEVLDDEGRYGNSTLVFNREGEIVGRYFKAYQAVAWPPGADEPEWMMDPGQEFPVFDLDFGRIGILTCYDGYFPEPFRILSLKGAEVIVWPNARLGGIEDHIVLANVQWNYVHMVCVNKSLGSGTMIAEWPQGIKERVDDTVEAYIVADLDLDRLRTGRIHAREFHQRRPQLAREILEPGKVWEYYGVSFEDQVIPEPDTAERTRILKGIGVSVPAEPATP